MATPPRLLARLGLAAAVGAAYLGAGELGHALSLPGPVATFWPPSGVLLVALLAAPRRAWGELLAASLAAGLPAEALIHARPWLSGFALWMATASGSCAGALAIARLTGGRPHLGKLRDVAVLYLVSAAAIAPLAAALGALAGPASTAGSFAAAWRTGWLANLLGILAIAPAFLAFLDGSRLRPPRLDRRSVVEALLLLTVLVVSTQLTYGAAPPLRLPRGVPALAMLWAAFRFGPRGGAIAMTLMTLTVLLTVADRTFSMPSLGASPELALWEIQGFLCLSFGSVLVISALSEERAVLVSQLESEVRTLRGLIPICAHCKQIRDVAGVWHPLESYLREHTDADFSHGICPSCVALYYGDLTDDR